MWNKSWIEPLQTHLSQSRNTHSHLAIVGVGHELRGDDSAGIQVIYQLLRRGVGEDTDWLCLINANHAPENFTGVLRSFQPALVIIIDSANLCEVPGAVRWLSWREVGGMSGSTHTLPLSMLANYLVTELKCEVALLGIQPATTVIGASRSPDVEKAIETIVNVLSETLSEGLR